MSTDEPTPPASSGPPAGTGDDAPPSRPTRTPDEALPDGVRPAVEDDLDEPVAEPPPADAERRGRDPVRTPLPPDAPDPLDDRREDPQGDDRRGDDHTPES